jgi:hypothetical protein
VIVLIHLARTGNKESRRQATTNIRIKHKHAQLPCPFPHFHSFNAT